MCVTTFLLTSRSTLCKRARLLLLLLLRRRPSSWRRAWVSACLWRTRSSSQTVHVHVSYQVHRSQQVLVRRETADRQDTPTSRCVRAQEAQGVRAQQLKLIKQQLLRMSLCCNHAYCCHGDAIQCSIPYRRMRQVGLLAQGHRQCQLQARLMHLLLFFETADRCGS